MRDFFLSDNQHHYHDKAHLSLVILFIYAYSANISLRLKYINECIYIQFMYLVFSI